MSKIERTKGERIILDERKEVEKILSSPTLNIDYRKIFMIAKYYYEEGLKKKDVEKKVLEYCEKSNTFNIYFFQEMIEKILKKAGEHHLKRSDQNIAITKREIDNLKVLPHKIYRIALYMLFIAKFEKFQVLSKVDSKIKKSKSFKTYFNYDIKTALYSVQILKEDKNIPSRKEAIEISKILVKNKIINLIFLSNSCEILIADFESKDVEFVIESNLEFEGQIKYYCLKCGSQCEKARKHDFCEECQKIDLRNRNLEAKKKQRKINVIG